jgi:hypothetical protein
MIDNSNCRHQLVDRITRITPIPERASWVGDHGPRRHSARFADRAGCHWLWYSSWRRIHIIGPSSSLRPFGARSRIA